MKWRVIYQPKSCERDGFVTEDETEYHMCYLGLLYHFT